MERSAQLDMRPAALFFEWVPRTVNKEADAVADGRLDGIDPALRVLVDFSRIRWLALNRLLAADAAFRRETERKDFLRPVGRGRERGART